MYLFFSVLLIFLSSSVQSAADESQATPDIRSDSYEILQYVALTYLEQRFPDARVKIDDTKDVMHGSRDDETQKQYGRMALRYSVDGKDRGWTKLKFKKNAEGWAVDHQLKPFEFFAAHDNPGTGTKKVIEYLVAQYVEDELSSGNKDIFVHGVSMTSWHGSFFAEVEIRYHVGAPGQKFKRRFLLVPWMCSWKVRRELEPDEIVDYDKGKIRRKE
jgi:hypothetical protein